VPGQSKADRLADLSSNSRAGSQYVKQTIGSSRHRLSAEWPRVVVARDYSCGRRVKAKGKNKIIQEVLLQVFRSEKPRRLGKIDTIHERMAPNAVAIGQLEDGSALRGSAEFVAFADSGCPTFTTNDFYRTCLDFHPRDAGPRTMWTDESIGGPRSHRQAHFT
jgi:hypothetical protein